MIQLNPFVEKVLRTVESHRLSEGVYCRWLWQNEIGDRELGANEYGCADAANILYSIGHFPRDPEARAHWVRALQDMQNPQTGLFTEKTHHTIHTTAHCVAALELFDAQPLYPLHDLKQYLGHDQLRAMLSSLNWDHNPWPQSHQGAGLFASLIITRMCDPAWQDAYFTWLKENADPETGLGLRGRRGTAPLAHQLYGWFHYLFNHVHAHRPFPYPEKIIDSCISLYENRDLSPVFSREVGFMEIDWIFAMNRASRQTPHRFSEVKALLSDMAHDFLPWLMSLDETSHDMFNDLHMLFGAVCAAAELQLALPGQILTDVPLKNVLDRRPFI
ncbi:MAG: hypothetical protein J6K55_13770 [Clostridia bacterium]|nr:hypothetical protein [Clostridia bacterium]